MSDIDLSKLSTEEGIEIAPGVRVRLRSLADYQQNPENPVAHTPRNLGSVVESIHKVGAARSGFASKGKILAGNLTWDAMTEAGIEGVVEITTDGTKWVMVNREDLSPEQEKQAAYGDQQGSFLASYDLDQVLADVEAEVDLSGIIENFELEDILGEALAGVETGEAPEAQVDKGAELAEHYGVEVGQVWQLGEHRLAVGDCTDKAVVDAVMRGEKAQLVFTDPPYGVDYDGGTTVREKLKGDTDTNLYYPACQMAANFSDEKAALYLWHAGVKGIAAAAAAAAAAAGYEIRCEIIWNKNQAQFGALSAQYKQKHEPCYYCYKRGNAPRWFGPTNEVTVWDHDRKPVNEFHPTEKPIELAERAIRNSSKLADIVADWFLGGGSTLIACERLGRKCRAIEIEPKYCAITIQRWVDLMGLEPKLLP